MAANEDELGNLHRQVTKAFIEGVTPKDVTDPDTGEVTMTLQPSAAMLAAASAFLKANHITCAPSGDNEMGELARKLEERKDRRRARRAGREELSEAVQEAGFLRGLN